MFNIEKGSLHISVKLVISDDSLLKKNGWPFFVRKKAAAFCLLSGIFEWITSKSKLRYAKDFPMQKRAIASLPVLKI